MSSWDELIAESDRAVIEALRIPESTVGDAGATEDVWQAAIEYADTLQVKAKCRTFEALSYFAEANYKWCARSCALAAGYNMLAQEIYRQVFDGWTLWRD